MPSYEDKQFGYVTPAHEDLGTVFYEMITSNPERYEEVYALWRDYYGTQAHEGSSAFDLAFVDIPSGEAPTEAQLRENFDKTIENLQDIYYASYTDIGGRHSGQFRPGIQYDSEEAVRDTALYGKSTSQGFGSISTLFHEAGLHGSGGGHLLSEPLSPEVIQLAVDQGYPMDFITKFSGHSEENVARTGQDVYDIYESAFKGLFNMGELQKMKDYMWPDESGIYDRTANEVKDESIETRVLGDSKNIARFNTGLAMDQNWLLNHELGSALIPLEDKDTGVSFEESGTVYTEYSEIKECATCPTQYMVYPTIFENKSGKLEYMASGAFNHAKETNQYLLFDSADAANSFSIWLHEMHEMSGQNQQSYDLLGL